MSTTLSPLDLVNHYLVSLGIKPATSIRISPTPGKDFPTLQVEGRHAIKRGSTTSFSKESIQELRKNLLELEMPYDVRKKTVPILDDKGISHHSERAVYVFGKDEASRKNLYQALEAISQDNTNLLHHQHLGTALGYPEAAITAYQNNKESILFNNQLQSMTDQGLAIPTWVSYCSWIPEPAQWKEGEEPAQSKALAQFYQKTIREKAPKLAQLVEAESIITPKQKKQDNNITPPQGYIFI